MHTLYPMHLLAYVTYVDLLHVSTRMAGCTGMHEGRLCLHACTLYAYVQRSTVGAQEALHVIWKSDRCFGRSAVTVAATMVRPSPALRPSPSLLLAYS